VAKAAQFGRQRLGEMEINGLQALWRSLHLQELLRTAKSDDVYGRCEIYGAIVKGEAAVSGIGTLSRSMC